MGISLAELNACRAKFLKFKVRRDGDGAVMEPGYEEALIAKPAMDHVCLGCYAQGYICSRFQQIGDSLPRAIATFPPSIKSAVERQLAITQADHLAPCGLLGTALSMIAQ